MINVTENASYQPAPAGQWPAVLCDVVELGIVESIFAGVVTRKRKVRLIWQIDTKMEDGRPFTVSSRFTASLHEKASLRKMLESWRGRSLSAAELKSFDLEDLIGLSAYLNVTQVQRGEKTFANVTTIMPLPRTMIAPEIKDYVRVKDRTTADRPAVENGQGGTLTEPVSLCQKSASSN